MNIDSAAVQFIAAAEGAAAAVAVSSSSVAAVVAVSSTTVVSGPSGTAPPQAEGLVGAADDADDHFFVPNLPPNNAILLPPIAHLNEGDVIGDTVVIHEGKGDVTCNCKGECNTDRCSCKKAGRICSSACHRNTSKCINHDRID